MTIKRLSLEPWMIRDHEDSEPLLGSESYPEYSSVVLGKDGYYFSCGLSWIEVNGVSFLADPVHWKHKFGIVCASELTQEQVDALHAIVKAKLATKQQRNLLQKRIDFEVDRNVRRDMKLRVMKWRKSKS